MVVSDAELEPGGAARWRDTPYEFGVAQGGEHVVDGLNRDRSGACDRLHADLFDIEMATVLERIEHRDAWPCHAKAALAQLDVRGHVSTEPCSLERFKKDLPRFGRARSGDESWRADVHRIDG